MSLIGKLLGWTGIPQWLLEVGIIAVVVGAIWLSGVFHEKGKIELRTIKQQAEAEHQVIVTDHSHDQELSDLRQYRATHPLNPFRVPVCPVTAGASGGRPSPAPGDVLPLPTRDSDVSSGPDVSGLLDLLAARADEVSAALRRRQTLEP